VGTRPKPPNAGKGRKPGVPNKATKEIRERARELIEDPIGMAKTLELYRRGKLHPAVVQMYARDAVAAAHR
jgi:hypothetical protein